MELYKYNLKDFTDKEYEYWYSAMNEELKNKIDDLKNKDDKRRSVCGYMLAIKGIAKLTCSDENKIEISKDVNGKPYCKNHNIYFNISHCDDLVICGVSLSPIGVDTEKIRKTNLNTAKKICTDNELKYIFGSNPSEADFESQDEKYIKRFLEIWVRKEALGKKDGVGIAYKMKETDVMHIPVYWDNDYVIAVSE